MPAELDAARRAQREAESEVEVLTAERTSMAVALREAEAEAQRMDTESKSTGSARANLEARMEQWERQFEQNHAALETSEEARQAQVGGRFSLYIFDYSRSSRRGPKPCAAYLYIPVHGLTQPTNLRAG